MLIGVCGKAKAGKDTFADFAIDIAKEWGATFVRKVAFAETLKEGAAATLGISVDKLYNQDFKASKIAMFPNHTYREFLQYFGTKMREFEPDFWVRITMQKMPNYETGLTMISDVRYRNEAEAIRKAGGLLVRIDRIGAGAGNHPSETELDNYEHFDYRFENNRSLDALKGEARKFLFSHNFLNKKNESLNNC